MKLKIRILAFFGFSVTWKYEKTPREAIERQTRRVVERNRGLRGSFSSATELRKEMNSPQADTTKEACTVIIFFFIVFFMESFKNLNAVNRGARLLKDCDNVELEDRSS